MTLIPLGSSWSPSLSSSSPLQSTLSLFRSSVGSSSSSSLFSSPPQTAPTTETSSPPKNRLLSSFSSCKSSNQAALVPYLTAGFPQAGDTVSLLLGLQSGGATCIEVGVPYSDPQADGPTVQRANEVALANGVDSIGQCLGYVREAREKGLEVPVVLMGYYNSFFQFGGAKKLGEEG